MASTVLHGAAAALILAFGSSMALADDPSSATGANQHLDPE